MTTLTVTHDKTKAKGFFFAASPEFSKGVFIHSKHCSPDDFTDVQVGSLIEVDAVETTSRGFACAGRAVLID